MNFIVENADFVFNLQTQQVNGSNVLTAFTATLDSTNYVCAIQLVQEGSMVEEVFCCTPQGCTSGACLPS